MSVTTVCNTDKINSLTTLSRSQNLSQMLKHSAPWKQRSKSIIQEYLFLTSRAETLSLARNESRVVIMTESLRKFLNFLWWKRQTVHTQHHSQHYSERTKDHREVRIQTKFLIRWERRLFLFLCFGKQSCSFYLLTWFKIQKEWVWVKIKTLSIQGQTSHTGEKGSLINFLKLNIIWSEE